MTFFSVKTNLLFAAVLLVTQPTCLRAADPDVEVISLDKERMDHFLNQEAEKFSQEAFERISTKAKLETQRDHLRHEFRFMIGLEPLPPRISLEVNHVCKLEQEDYTIEVLSFQSLPHFYATASLYKPKRGNPRFPAVVWGAWSENASFHE
jgi:hypothetical protein